MVHVLKNDGNRNYSYEMVNVLEDSGEGRFFFKTGWCEEVLKKVVLEPLASALGEGLFYIMLL